MEIRSFFDKHDDYLAFGLILMFLFAFAFPWKSLTTLSGGDEMLYIYFSKAVSQGYTPYVDFFFAHPPLFIYFYGFLIGLFGPNIFALKFATLVIGIANLFLSFIIAKEIYGKYFATAISFLAILIFAHVRNFFFISGSILPVFLILVSILVYIKMKNPHHAMLMAGSLVALSCLFRLNSSAFFISFAAFLVIRKEYKNALIFTAVFLAIFGSFFTYLYMMSNGNFLYDVFLYHGAKANQNYFSTFFNTKPEELMMLVMDRIPEQILLIISLAVFLFIMLCGKLKSVHGLFAISFLSFLVFNLLTYGNFFWYQYFLYIFSFFAFAFFLHNICSRKTEKMTIIFVIVTLCCIFFLNHIQVINYDLNDDADSRTIKRFIESRISENETILTLSYDPGIGAAFLGNFSIPPDLVDTNSLRKDFTHFNLSQLLRYAHEYNIRFVLVPKGYDTADIYDYLKTNTTLVARVRNEEVYDVADVIHPGLRNISSASDFDSNPLSGGPISYN